ncbi:MAG: Arc family DNA-binding protein [Chelatococcus sp.]|uniref:Arc family DNA-binding protein n=1 Tax=Chelatococcus sp. TaxID=1953771 RepID=UPI0025B95E0A|nr:Arc family DNA-binding protein [Chelatococcus sp.]MBX3536555.1 Arc family DNA-binding protein [Chelatococcus sp.]
MSREDPQLKVRVSPELKERLVKAAEGGKRSLNAEIVARLEATFEEGTGHGPGSTRGSLLMDLLPAGLAGRVRSAAESRGQSAEEEIVQALEVAFPPPPSFSLDWFNEEWIGRILSAEPWDREDLVDKANEVLKANGDKYEVWLGDANTEDSAAVIFGSKGLKNVPRRPKR